MRHKLKTWPEEFKAIKIGRKKFEFRKDDRGFQEGDELLLEEFVPCESCKGTGRSYEHSANGEGEACGCGAPHGHYTGKFIEVYITYILRTGFGLPPGHVILSIV